MHSREGQFDSSVTRP
nr:unnamed protein product [Callosobruchus chinensis]CAH7749175.1 unnamed protein product [Callosobruchus chinensis]